MATLNITLTANEKFSANIPPTHELQLWKMVAISLKEEDEADDIYSFLSIDDHSFKVPQYLGETIYAQYQHYFL